MNLSINSTTELHVERNKNKKNSDLKDIYDSNDNTISKIKLHDIDEQFIAVSSQI